MMVVQGFDIDCLMLVGWIGQVVVLLYFIVMCICDEVFKVDKIYVDDMLVLVFDFGWGKIVIGWLWVYVNDDWVFGSMVLCVIWYCFIFDCIVVYLLVYFVDFCGFLQVDVYVGYDGLYWGGVIEVVCWVYFWCKVFDFYEWLFMLLIIVIFEWIGVFYVIEVEVCG